ncbi:MAG: zf-HC2 domain-containing protein [Gemmatimonadetes bacterium]|nr:zf-HC2 domain-containing protein [Gemmatimonadota bacterium]
MSHLETGTLQNLLDGELSDADRTTVDAHLAACGSCAVELQELRVAATDFASAVALVDVSAPLLRARAALDDAHGRVIDRGLRRAGLLTGAPAAFVKAAAVVLMLAGAASAAIPGSPVRRWASELFDRAARLFGGGEAESGQIAAPASQPGTGLDEVAQDPIRGIRVAPANGGVRVALHSVTEGARISIRHTDDVLASVNFTATVAAPANYRSSAGSIDVYGIPTTDVVIWLPRNLARATVEVDGRVYYTRRNGEERILGPGAESHDGGVTFQMRS